MANRRVEPYVPDGPIEIPAGDLDKLAQLVLLYFRLHDEGDPDVLTADIPPLWKCQGVDGPGDHHEPAGLALDASGCHRVRIIPREQDGGRPGRDGKFGPYLEVIPRYVLALADWGGARRWVIRDNQVRRSRSDPGWAFVGEILPDGGTRLDEVHRIVAAQRLVRLYPRHADPLAYWGDAE
jgi:hypothetical protein